MITKETLNTLVFLLLCVSGHAMKLNFFGDINDPEEGDVRLGGSQSLSEGRVEVYHNGRWGTVCDDDWDLNEAHVVCRQLNFPGAKSVVTGKDYGEAPGPIWLDDMICKGTEAQLVSCRFKGWGVTDCSHKEDVGVICETGNNNVTINNSTYSINHRIKMYEEFGRMFDSGLGCDFKIVLQSPTGNKNADDTPEILEETICAHKLFLSVLANFDTSSGTTNITVSMTCRPHFLSFIRYFYNYKIDVTFSSAMCLHQMASKFGVKQLQEDVGRLFTQILPDDATFSTQLSLYQYAVETEDLMLEENSIQFLAWNYQNLTSSPAWDSVSVKFLQALLTRSDVVVPDEYFLLQTLENWITEKNDSLSLETQADLLSRIRFPMISAEKLYELEHNSPLYNTHKNLYLMNTLKALNFNVLLFNNLMTKANFDKESPDYKPRIYTAALWSTTVDSPGSTSPEPVQSYRQQRRRYNNGYGYGYNNGYDYYYPSLAPYVQANSFETPVHTSLIFKGKTTTWQVDIFKTKSACSSRGLSCDSVPAARLNQRSSSGQQSNIVFRNRFLIMCQDRYIFQVQGFKGDMAYVPTNSSQAYPCADENYKYIFVVRPEFV